MPDYKGIDLIKFLMSFCVIAIHAPEYLFPYERLYPLFLSWLIRLAVPFFFIASGYLIQQRLNNLSTSHEKQTYLFKKAKRMACIWSVWVVIYLPLSIWGLQQSNAPIASQVSTFLTDLLLSGHSIYAQPLWFIYSMAITLFLFGLSYRFGISQITLFIIFSALALIASGLSIDTNYKRILFFALGGGLPMTIGIIIGSKRQLINIFLSISTLLISFILFYMDSPFSNQLGGYGLFVMALMLNLKNINTLKLRYQSMWIFYIHMYIIISFMVLIRHFGIVSDRYVLLLSACCVTWLLSILILWSGKFKALHFIQKLIK